MKDRWTIRGNCSLTCHGSDLSPNRIPFPQQHKPNGGLANEGGYKACAGLCLVWNQKDRLMPDCFIESCQLHLVFGCEAGEIKVRGPCACWRLISLDCLNVA